MAKKKRYGKELRLGAARLVVEQGYTQAEAATQAVDRARAGEGPTLLELITYRITGHSRRDPCLYQSEAEREEALKKEPIGRFSQFLLEQRSVDRQALDRIGDDVDSEIEAAVESAVAAPHPKPEDTLKDLFVVSDDETPEYS